MPGGVVFLVCIPTLNYEHELVFGVPVKRSKKIEKSKNKIVGPKVDLRLKETKNRAQLLTLDDDGDNEDNDVGIDVGIEGRKYPRGYPMRSKSPVFVSMETVKYSKEHYKMQTLQKDKTSIIVNINYEVFFFIKR